MNKGIKQIYNKKKNLLKLFIKELKKNPKIEIYGPLNISDRSGVVPVNISGMDSSELSYLLDANYKIAVRSGLHCAPLAHKALGTDQIGAVRFSVGPFNTKKDIMAAVDALNEISILD